MFSREGSLSEFQGRPLTGGILWRVENTEKSTCMMKFVSFRNALHTGVAQHRRHRTVLNHAVQAVPAAQVPNRALRGTASKRSFPPSALLQSVCNTGLSPTTAVRCPPMNSVLRPDVSQSFHLYVPPQSALHIGGARFLRNL